MTDKKISLRHPPVLTASTQLIKLDDVESINISRHRATKDNRQSEISA